MKNKVFCIQCDINKQTPAHDAFIPAILSLLFKAVFFFYLEMSCIFHTYKEVSHSFAANFAAGEVFKLRGCNTLSL